MKRRFIFYMALILLTVGITYSVFRKNAPMDVEVITEPITYNIVPLYSDETVDQAIMEHAGSVNVIFYDGNTTDSVYLFNTILTQVLSKKGISMLENTIYCNIRDMKDKDIMVTKNRWGFYYCPALINIEYKEGILAVNSSLEWSETNHLTYSTVETWLRNNDAIPK